MRYTLHGSATLGLVDPTLITNEAVSDNVSCRKRGKGLELSLWISSDAFICIKKVYKVSCIWVWTFAKLERAIRNRYHQTSSKHSDKCKELRLEQNIGCVCTGFDYCCECMIDVPATKSSHLPRTKLLRTWPPVWLRKSCPCASASDKVLLKRFQLQCHA